MSEGATLRVATSGTPVMVHQKDPDWEASSHQIVIGKDVLELLSTSMYVDPMTIYREYIQNAADAIDEARARKTLPPAERGRVDVTLDVTSRSITIRDNGIGLPWNDFENRLSNLGASIKRGTQARGFRGVGRLAGLGYCQELVFRSRADGERLVAELRWDCRRLKSALRSVEVGKDVSTLIREVVSIRRVQGRNYPARFFEVELKGVIRHRNDRLLSPQVVSDYISQVAPVPFSPDFQFGGDISAALRPHTLLGELDIRINDLQQPIYRPHRNNIEIDDGEFDQITDLELRELTGMDGSVAAVVWILHRGYSGAIPSKALVKGVRFRTGNMQVGDHALLEELFPEPRFNSWAVGEVHVLDSRVVPNGRRDHFEQNVHLDNLLNQLAPFARDIARRCRQSSITRKWLRDFELHKAAAIETARSVARGGLSRAARKVHSEAVAKSLAAMRKVANQKHLSEEIRTTLTSGVEAAEARVAKLLGAATAAPDPLARFRPETRSAYQRIIALIYECASTRVAASALVDKILSKLNAGSKRNVVASHSAKRSRSR